MRVVRLYLLSLALLTTAEPGLHAQPQALSCHGTQQVRQVAELLFGRDIGRKLGVSESDWARFVSREITPRFPDGLTPSSQPISTIFSRNPSPSSCGPPAFLSDSAPLRACAPQAAFLTSQQKKTRRSSAYQWAYQAGLRWIRA